MIFLTFSELPSNDKYHAYSCLSAWDFQALSALINIQYRKEVNISALDKKPQKKQRNIIHRQVKNKET